MLSQAVGYAATALAYVAAAGGKPVLVKEIAEAADIPAAYLAKIVQTLARKNLVITQRGIGGGVTLARAAQDITIFEICAALDDPAIQERCMLGTAQCSDDRSCPMHSFWTQHRSRQHDFLKRMTVADVAAFETRRRWRQPDAPGMPAPLQHPGHNHHSAGQGPAPLRIKPVDGHNGYAQGYDHADGHA